MKNNQIFYHCVSGFKDSPIHSGLDKLRVALKEKEFWICFEELSSIKQAKIWALWNTFPKQTLDLPPVDENTHKNR